VADEVPEAHQQAAEEVRAHLVLLRGGAPFLSPADARLLLGWLDRAVPVPEILRALERAADARRRRPTRLPFTLGQARRHLARVAGPLVRTSGPSLGPLVDELRRRARDDAHGADLRELAERLAALSTDDPDRLVRAAVGQIRVFFATLWEALPVADREQRSRAARLELTGLEAVLTESLFENAVEETARADLRAEYAFLTAATVCDLVSS
jgi:hypothetical protein